MDSGVVSCKTVGTDCIYSASEGTFSKDNCCNDSKDQNQEKNVRNTSYFSAKCSKTFCVCYGNTSTTSKNDLCNTSENDLGCKCYDHWRQFFKSGKDKCVYSTAKGSNQKCGKDYHDEWSSCVCHNTSHCCGETHDRSNGNIDLAKYQNVCHRQHQEDFCQINRHLAEQTLQIIELRKVCAENIYCNKQEYQNAFPAEDHLFHRAFRHVVNTSSRFSSHDYISLPFNAFLSAVRCKTMFTTTTTRMITPLMVFSHS